MVGTRPGLQPFAGLEGVKRVTIHVGEVFAASTPAIVQTLLGSCVSVCLVDRQAKVGGMNHILLPGRTSTEKLDESARYGVNAMEMLIGKVRRLGAERTRLEAKIFGGATIIDGLESALSPGLRNGTFAMEFLDREGIPVTGRDVGGCNARRIFFRTDTGEVFMRRIPRCQASGVVVEEHRLRQRIQKEITGRGKTELPGT